MLEADSYSNLSTTDCELSSFNSEDVIMALTMPGMKKNLEYLSIDTSSADINDAFSFEFDTEAFEIGFSTTIVSTDFLDESMDLSELDDLNSSLAELKSAGKKVADAGSTLEGGMDEYRKYLSNYTEGADSLDTGIANLAKGINELDKNKKGIYDGAKGIGEGITALEGAYSEAQIEVLEQLDKMIEEDPDNETLKELRQKYEETYTALGDELNSLSEDATNYVSSVSDFNSGISGIKDGVSNLRKGSLSLSGSGEGLLDGYDELKNGACEYAGGVETFYEEGIKKLYSEGSTKISDIKSFVRMMEKADNMYKTYSGCEEGQKSSVTFIIETENFSNSKRD